LVDSRCIANNKLGVTAGDAVSPCLRRDERRPRPRALALGFKADPGIDAVIRDYIADENIRTV